MRIVYLHQYFKTIHEPGSTRSYFICQELLKDGHEVIMISGKKEGQDEPIVRKKIDGIEVYFISNYYNNRLGLKERLKSFLRYMFKSIPILFKQKDVDLVIATSTPLTIGFPALLGKWFKKLPFVFEVRDLWPEVPIQMGALNNSVIRNIALWFEKTIYKNAVHIVALSPGMKEGVLEVEPKPEKVSMIPNMAKNNVFWPRKKNKELQEEIGLKNDSFKIIHFGTMGIANGLQYILDAAKILQEEKGVNNVEFIFLGDGKTKVPLEKFVEKNDLMGIHFLGKVPMVEASEIVNLCDVSIVPFKNIPILATNSPNKLFDSLSAGKPIIVNSNGWTRGIVEKHRCGAFVDPEDPVELADLIIDWKKNQKEVEKMGVNARKLSETTYDQSILCRKFADVINKVGEKIK